MSELFDNIGGRLVPKDICANRHKGNPESIQAFVNMKDILTLQQAKVFILIRGSENGRTVDELCRLLNTTPNAISGRVSELKAMGRIYKSGTRPTRSGCSAAVLKAT